MMPKDPVHDATLATLFAKKHFGDRGIASAVERGSNLTLYMVGVLHENGYFQELGGSYYDFAEAFQESGYSMCVRDPIWVAYELRGLSRGIEAKENTPEQFELAV